MLRKDGDVENGGVEDGECKARSYSLGFLERMYYTFVQIHGDQSQHWSPSWGKACVFILKGSMLFQLHRKS